MTVTMLSTLVVASAAIGVAAEDPRTSVLAGLASRLDPVFRRYYAGTKTNHEGERLSFEFNTRLFMIHVPLKTGEWQDAREVKGPNPRGILCSIEVVPGRYNGQAVLPQTFDERYFETKVAQVPSPDGSKHLYVRLSYPRGVDAKFLKGFWEIVDGAWTAK